MPTLAPQLAGEIDLEAVASRLLPALWEEIQLYARRHGLAGDEALGYLVEAGLMAEADAMLELERGDQSGAVTPLPPAARRRTS